MESLDLNNPTVLGAIIALAALIVIGVIIGLVRGRAKRQLPPAPPTTPPEALPEERPKIEIPEAPRADAEPTQPIRLEDLVPGAPQEPVEAPEHPPTLIPEPTVVPPPAPPADLGAFERGSNRRAAT